MVAIQTFYSEGTVLQIEVSLTTLFYKQQRKSPVIKNKIGVLDFFFPRTKIPQKNQQKNEII